MLALLLLLAADLFQVTGRISPAAQASVTLHAAKSPFSVTLLSDPGGRFRFRNIPPGAYTLGVFIPGRGELSRTIEVGPSTADSKRTVRVDLAVDDARLERSAVDKVTARELSVPERARREYAEAGRKLVRNDVAGAIRHLERAVELAPQFSAAWNHLGTIAYQTQRFRDAEKYFRRAIEADPDAYAPVVNLGGVLLNLGQMDEAWKYNIYAVNKRPADPLANSQLGMTYLALRKYELAEKYLLEARRLDPAHFSHPQLHLAEMYLLTGRRERAADQMSDFLHHHPDHPNASAMREAIVKLRQDSSR